MVWPPVWRPNELCAGQAFYVTNSIEQAIAHALYVCPRPPFLDVDPIVVLVFSVDVTVLHGDQPSPNSSIMFSVKWFDPNDPEHCKEFLEVCMIVSMTYHCSNLFEQHVEHNLRLHELSLTRLFDHIQIGPICMVFRFVHPYLLKLKPIL
jgi:hypothetical protein